MVDFCVNKELVQNNGHVAKEEVHFLVGGCGGGGMGVGALLGVGVRGLVGGQVLFEELWF